MTKFISWNVNGLRACMKPDPEKNRPGFEAVFRLLDADFFCLNETKMQAGQLDLSFDGYESYWNYADRKGYSGTAIFTKQHPLNVSYGMNIDEHDHEGRVITLEMPTFYLVSVYTPNSQNANDGEVKPRRLPYRMQWENDFRAYLLALDKQKPVIVCGDMNVAHEDIDLKNPKTQLLDSGFTDTFRFMHPDNVTYSWWSYRFRSREKNAGWRIDYFLVSKRLNSSIVDATILTDIMGSDHCPVGLELNL